MLQLIIRSHICFNAEFKQIIRYIWCFLQMESKGSFIYFSYGWLSLTGLARKSRSSTYFYNNYVKTRCVGLCPVINAMTGLVMFYFLIFICQVGSFIHDWIVMSVQSFTPIQGYVIRTQCLEYLLKSLAVRKTSQGCTCPALIHISFSFIVKPRKEKKRRKQRVKLKKQLKYYLKTIQILSCFR